MESRRVFISGGTGYVGRALVPQLIARGHNVRLLTRPGSERKVPAGAEIVKGNALDAKTFASAVTADDTFVQLTGVPHPAPWKEKEFRAIDLVSLRSSAEVAKRAGVRHFIYVSVAHPAPAMHAYIRVRQECEEILRQLQLVCTILRPWYILGPAHRWPVVLKPIYALLESLPSTRESALRLGLVTLSQMIQAMIWAIENPPSATRVLDVETIRELNSGRS